MTDARFLIVRLSSLGDVIHTLPAAAALRESFPDARIDWVIDPKWARLLEGNPSLTNRFPLDRKNIRSIARAIAGLRAAMYTCAIDFQSLYKSAILGFLSGTPRRLGFDRSHAREGLATIFYTECVAPHGSHKVDHNLSLVERVGAKPTAPRFPLAILPYDDDCVAAELSARGIADFFVLNPGGGWLSKRWPPERYGELHRKLAERHGWRGVVTFGPGEEGLARRVIEGGGDPPAAAIRLGLGPLMALMRRAQVVVSADSGPLHIASALGTPVVGLYGPTDPALNGPYSKEDIVVRNVQISETTYHRGKSYSASMLSITVDQVCDAVERRLRRLA
jgi:lipopolysaccharide heptosyltransferase I